MSTNHHITVRTPAPLQQKVDLDLAIEYVRKELVRACTHFALSEAIASELGEETTNELIGIIRKEDLFMFRRVLHQTVIMRFDQIQSKDTIWQMTDAITRWSGATPGQYRWVTTDIAWRWLEKSLDGATLAVASVYQSTALH